MPNQITLINKELSFLACQICDTFFVKSTQGKNLPNLFMTGGVKLMKRLGQKGDICYLVFRHEGVWYSDRLCNSESKALQKFVRFMRSASQGSKT